MPEHCSRNNLNGRIRYSQLPSRIRPSFVMNAGEGGKNKFQLKLVPKKFIKPAAWFPSVSPASISRRGQRRERLSNQLFRFSLRPPLMTTSLSLSLSFNDLLFSPQDLDNPWIIYNHFFESVDTKISSQIKLFLPLEIITPFNPDLFFVARILGTHQSFQSDETKVSAESSVLLQPVVRGDAGRGRGRCLIALLSQRCR